MKNKRLLTISILLLATCMLGLLSIVWIRGRTAPDNNSPTSTKLKINDYVHPDGIACEALTPGCGYCPGEVINNSCFLTQAEFDEYKKSYPELTVNN